MKLRKLLDGTLRERPELAICLPDRAWDVDQSIRAVQKRQRVLMPVHEPLLNTPLPYRKQKGKHSKLLRFQDRDSVLLCRIPNVCAAIQSLGHHASHAIECVVYDPVEHLYQEGEFLQYPTVDVVFESTRVRCMDDHAAALPRFWLVLRSSNRILCIVFVLRVVWY